MPKVVVRIAAMIVLFELHQEMSESRNVDPMQVEQIEVAEYLHDEIHQRLLVVEAPHVKLPAAQLFGGLRVDRLDPERTVEHIGVFVADK